MKWAALVLALAACKQSKDPTPASDLLAKARGISAKACACKDKACVEPLLREWNAMTTAIGGKGEVAGGTFTAEQVEGLAVEDERMMKCVASLGGAPTPSGSSSTAACDLAGSYRVRFQSNGKLGWWFRFTITGDTATLDEPANVIAIPKGPLALTKDGCAVTLTMKSDAVGTATMKLVVDPKTHAVSGTFDREKTIAGYEASTKVSGVHDALPPASTCIPRGVYKVGVGTTTWKNSVDGDQRPCDASRWIAPYVLVEPYGDSVVISVRESEPPHGERWGEDKVTKIDDCTVTAELQAEGFHLRAKLSFAADKITAVASLADVQVVEDGDAGENLWNCVATDAPLELTPVK